MKTKSLSNGLYSQWNWLIPFGTGPPPLPYVRISIEQRFFRQGLPLLSDLALVTRGTVKNCFMPGAFVCHMGDILRICSGTM